MSLCLCLCVSVPGLIDIAAEKYLHVYNGLNKLVALIRSTTEDPTALSELEKLQKTLQGSADEDDDDGPP